MMHLGTNKDTTEAEVEEADPLTVLKPAVDKFCSGLSSFQDVISHLTQAVEKERALLLEREQALRDEKLAFEAEQARVQHVLTDAEQVKLNVGGHKFTTTVSTLRHGASMSLFAAMFSGRHNLKPDDQGYIFIDRDGRHFHDILNYLRDGMLHYPPQGSDWKYLLELRAEADYYNLPGLMRAIDRYPYGLMRANRAGAMNEGETWMYEDGTDEVVMSVNRPCQLLGVGLCGTEGGFMVDLEVYEVAADDFANEMETLATHSQTFTHEDGKIPRMLLPEPITLDPAKIYMLSAQIKGSESNCCEECMAQVIAGNIIITFHPWESPNGTCLERGQFPEVYVRHLPQSSMAGYHGSPTTAAAAAAAAAGGALASASGN